MPFHRAELTREDLTSTDTRPDEKMSGYIASLAGVMFAGVALIGSTLLPKIVAACLQERSIIAVTRIPTCATPPYSTLLYLWSGSLMLSAALTFSTMLSSNFRHTVVLMAMNGLSWAVGNWIPYVLVGRCTVARSRASHAESIEATQHVGGAINGLHNVAIASPQMLSAAYAAQSCT